MLPETIVRLFFFPAPTCSNSCGGILPTVNFNDCDPKVNLSEINRIFMSRKTITPFTDWRLATQWLTRIGANNQDADAIRAFTVIADKPAAAPIIKDISNGRKKSIGKTHTINFTVDDVSQENYEFMQQIECGGYYAFWYETLGGFLYGGNSGITAFIDANNTLGRGREEIETILGTLTWQAKQHPERTLSPIFGSASAMSYDTTLTFTGATTDTDEGVTGTISATNATVQFKFNKVIPRVGSPVTMTIKLATVTVMTVDFASDYMAKQFQYTDSTGTIHTGTFQNGVVDF